MNRSLRELERRLDTLDEQDDERAPANYTLLEERYPADVVSVIRKTAIALLRIIHRNGDTVVNVPDDEGTEQYIALVREHYAIDDDRDEAVCRALEELAGDSWHHAPYGWFADAPLGVAARFDIETEAGETLSDLVHAGREENAARLLVSTVYHALAERGGRRMAVPA